MDTSTLSLIVAALAVVVGPMVSWAIAKRQIRSLLEVSSKQITAPMRQAWINKLRELLAEFTSSTLHYYIAGFEDRTDDEYQRVTLLEARIQLMLNPNEKDHQRLVVLMRSMVDEIEKGGSDQFPRLHTELVALSQKILKSEWDRVRKPINSDSLGVLEYFRTRRSPRAPKA